MKHVWRYLALFASGWIIAGGWMHLLQSHLSWGLSTLCGIGICAIVTILQGAFWLSGDYMEE